MSVNNAGRIGLAVAATLLGAGIAGDAGAVGSTITVTATIANNCHISTTTQMAFGAYDPLSGNTVAQTAALSVTCTTGDASVAIAMDGGQNHDLGVSGTSNAMTATVAAVAYYLEYALFADAAHTVPWGTTPIAATSTVGGFAADGTAHTVNVYGLIPASQTTLPASNAYTDTVNATITF